MSQDWERYCALDGRENDTILQQHRHEKNTWLTKLLTIEGARIITGKPNENAQKHYIWFEKMSEGFPENPFSYQNLKSYSIGISFPRTISIEDIAPSDEDYYEFWKYEIDCKNSIE